MAYNVIWTSEKKEAAIKKISEYLEKYGHGECICQRDDAIIEAPELMADIADHVLVEGEGLVWEES
jgi:hypothetical protein